MNSLVVCRSLNIADDTKGYRETMLIVHHSKLQLQGVVLAMCVVYEDVLLGNAILANLNHLQSETFLNETILVVLTEYKRLSMLYIDSVLLSALLIIYRVVAAVVEDDAVLQDLTYRSTLVLVCSLQNLNCLGSVCSD